MNALVMYFCSALALPSILMEWSPFKTEYEGTKYVESLFQVRNVRMRMIRKE